MHRRHLCAALVSGVMIVSATFAVSAQDEGVKRIEQLIKKANAQVQSVNEAEQQLQKTMNAYNAVLAPDVKDRRAAYKKLQQEIDSGSKTSMAAADLSKASGAVPKPMRGSR